MPDSSGYEYTLTAVIFRYTTTSIVALFRRPLGYTGVTYECLPETQPNKTVDGLVTRRTGLRAGGERTLHRPVATTGNQTAYTLIRLVQLIDDYLGRITYHTQYDYI